MAADQAFAKMLNCWTAGALDDGSDRPIARAAPATTKESVRERLPAILLFGLLFRADDRVTLHGR